MSLSDRLRLPCGAVLANRLAKSAMSEQLAEADGTPSERLIRLYERWASSGAALLITGNVMIDRSAPNEPRNVVLEDERCLRPFERWSAAGRSLGAEVWMQLMHPGRQAPLSRARPVAPSAVAMRRGRLMFQTPRPLSEEEIERIIDRFARSACLARRVGFTGVQIHAAHGYLINQFLSPLTNRRQDRWGGTPENRRRFLVEVVRRVRRAVGRDFAVCVKLNSADFQRGGFSHEESLDVIAELSADDVDLIEISGGTWESTAMFDHTRRRTVEREAYFLDYARGGRRVASVPLMVTGGFRTRSVMERALAHGALDVVGLARPMAREPDLPRQLLSGQKHAAFDLRLGVGWSSLDGFLETAWHQQQLERLGDGLDPKLDLSRAHAIWKGVAAFAPLLIRSHE